MILSRRRALLGLFSAAPAIVAAPSLMRVSAAALEPPANLWWANHAPSLRPLTSAQIEAALKEVTRYYLRPQLIMVGNEAMNALHIIAPENVGYRPLRPIDRKLPTWWRSR